MRKSFTRAVLATTLAVGLSVSGAGSAQAVTGKVSNWCMGTNHAVQVASGPSLTYNVHCNSSRTGHAVKSFYPMRVAQNGTNRCYGPGQWVQIQAASVDVYTVRSC